MKFQSVQEDIYEVFLQQYTNDLLSLCVLYSDFLFAKKRLDTDNNRINMFEFYSNLFIHKYLGNIFN